MNWRLEGFEPRHYPLLGKLLQAVYPEYPGFLEETRHTDEHRPAHCKAGRWLVLDDDQVIGSCEFRQSPTMYHPRRFDLELYVHPDHWERGLGTRLYERLLAGLAPHRPIGLRSFVKDDEPRGMRFAEDRGFVPVQYDVESRLELGTFDPGVAEADESALAARGIVLRSLPELDADPDRDPKLYALRCEIMRDVPAPHPPTEEGYDNWLEGFYGNPALIREAVAVALDGERYVGFSNLYDAGGESVLYTGLTGTLRDYRGRGIAQALRHRNLAWAKAAGRRTVMTWNERKNADVLAINANVGFKRAVTWINYVREIEESGNGGRP